MSSQTINTKRWFSKEWLLEQKSLIALLVLIAVVSSLSPNFFTLNNMFNILQQTSVNAIMAVGMTLVILTSGIDLSVGSLLALTGASPEKKAAIAKTLPGRDFSSLLAAPAWFSWNCTCYQGKFSPTTAGHFYGQCCWRGSLAHGG